MSPRDYTEAELVEAYLIANGMTGDEPSSWANDELLGLVWQDPERAWPIICLIVERKPPKWILGILGAGPLEDLLRAHGSRFIDRIEEFALQNELFRCDVLACVYPIACHPERVADRVRAVCHLESERPKTQEQEAQQAGA
ncbi:DUF6869 domain-containing protein [Haloferula sp. A504]|uniref:DUF6869 domain-containing protein n=1 Tax=Haloferula sp. A504 TaxID=3373601 RepID=UPI0031C98562|nr:hypothetical protein [Verrucomicrobiaceae bacterium E54]